MCSVSAILWYLGQAIDSGQLRSTIKEQGMRAAWWTCWQQAGGKQTERGKPMAWA